MIEGLNAEVYKLGPLSKQGQSMTSALASIANKSKQANS